MLAEIKQEIDRLREDMIALAIQHNMDLQHPEILLVSQHIDQLIVQYMKLYNRGQ